VVYGDRSGFVYVIQDGSGLCKIGRARDVGKRIQSLSTGSSSELTLIASWPCDDAGEREATLHEFWSDVRVRGEWFKLPADAVAVYRDSSGTRIPCEDDEDAWDALLMSRASAEPIRLGETLARRSRLPDGWHDLPDEDGIWWIAKHAQRVECPRCGERFPDHPAVMRYVPSKDWGGLARKTQPHWVRDGWAIWREHDACGWRDWKTETATTGTIRSWMIGPWRPLP
jgi:hypothetical protein